MEILNLDNVDVIKSYGEGYVRNLYRKYNYLDKKVIDRIINDAINTLRSNNCERLESGEFTNILSKDINEYVVNLINNDKNFLHSYINANITKESDVKNSLKSLSKLSKLFCDLDTNFDIEVYREVLRNDIIHNNVSIIVKFYKDKLRRIALNDIFEDDVISSLIQVYCTDEKIELYDYLIDENIDSDTNKDSSYIGDSDLSSINLFFNEMKNFPLLSVEEERKLLILIKEENDKVKAYHNEIIKLDEECLRLYNEGKIDLAKEKENEKYKVQKEMDNELQKVLKHKNYFINCNLRLVVSVAKHYIGKGLDLLDLISEGNLGLMKAFDMYDYSKSNKFSTYATWWIRQHITRAISDKGRNIRIPYPILKKHNDYIKACQTLEKKLGRTPDESELAKYLNISVTRVRNMSDELPDTISLHTKVVNDKNGGESELGDFIESDCLTPEEAYQKACLPDTIKVLLKKAKLNDSEISVLTLRFGLTGNEPMSLLQVSDLLNVSKERIRQIEEQALNKIRSYKGIKDYSLFLQNPIAGNKRIDEFNQLRIGKPTRKVKMPKEHIKKKRTSNDSLMHNDVVPKKHKKIKNIYEKFEGYSKSKVDELLKRLPEDIQALLKKKYGSNYMTPDMSSVSATDNARINQIIIPRLKKMLEDNSFEYHIEKVLDPRVKTLYMVLDKYSKEEVDEMLKRVPEDIIIMLKTRYGEEYVTPNSKSLTSLENSKLNNVIIPTLKKMLADKSLEFHDDKMSKPRIRPFYKTLYGYSKEEIDEMLKRVPEDIIVLLKSKYGDNYMSPDMSRISTTDNARINQIIIPKLRKMLEDKSLPYIREKSRAKRVHKEKLDTQPIFDVEKDEVINISPEPIQEENKQEIILYDFLTYLYKIDPTGAEILALRLGYYGGKCCSIASIARTFNKTEEETQEAFNNALAEYKELIASFVDDKPLNDDKEINTSNKVYRIK